MEIEVINHMVEISAQSLEDWDKVDELIAAIMKGNKVKLIFNYQEYWRYWGNHDMPAFREKFEIKKRAIKKLRKNPYHDGYDIKAEWIKDQQEKKEMIEQTRSERQNK